MYRFFFTPDNIDFVQYICYIQNMVMKFKTNLIILLFLFFAFNAIGQVLPNRISIANVEKHNDRVEFRLQSTSPFYVGAQPYVLQLGTLQFDLSLHEDSDSLHTLIFLIPLAQFKALPAAVPAYLSYGPILDVQQINTDTSAPQQSIDKTSCYLGIFTKPASIK